MKLENQVVSLEVAKKLKELGVKQDAFWSWYCDEERDDTPVLNRTEQRSPLDSPGFFTHQYSAFTVAELGEMLPHSFDKDSLTFNLSCLFKTGKRPCVGYNAVGTDVDMCEWVFEDTEANARAKMLLYLIDKNIIRSSFTTSP